MTLQDLLDQITLEGYYKIQCWEDADYPNIYYEGYGFPPDMMEQYGNRKIRYIFPYMYQTLRPLLRLNLKRRIEYVLLQRLELCRND